MKLSTVAILLGAAVAAVPGVVSAEVSSCLDGRGLVGGCISREFVLPWSGGRLCMTAAVIIRALHTLLSARDGMNDG